MRCLLGRVNGFYKAGISRNTEEGLIFLTSGHLQNRLLWGNTGAGYFLTSRLSFIPEFSESGKTARILLQKRLNVLCLMIFPEFYQ